MTGNTIISGRKSTDVSEIENIHSTNHAAHTNEKGLSKSAFGELLVTQPVPQVQLQFPYNINTNFVKSTLSGSGTLTQSDAMAVASTGAAISSGAAMDSVTPVKYLSGQGGRILFTAMFTAGVAGSVQEAGAGDNVNGFFVGFNGTSFSINRRSNGLDNYISQASFNEDLLDGTGKSGITIDPTKLNVFQIQFQYLGAGAIKFSVENSNTGEFVPFHIIKYSNLNIVPSLYNPSLPLRIKAENTTNSTNIIIKTASMAGFIEGIGPELGSPYSHVAQKSTITTETAIFSIRSLSNFAAVLNKVISHLIFINASSDGTKNVDIRIYKNATLGGVPAWVEVDSGLSVIEYDESGTTVSGGKLVFSTTLAKVDQLEINVSELHIYINPGETLTLTAQSVNASDVGGSLSWKELF